MSSLPPRDDPAARTTDQHTGGGARAVSPDTARPADPTDTDREAGARAVGPDTARPADPSDTDREAGARAVGPDTARRASPSGAEPLATDRQAVLAREKERFGGIKWGSAFFGWLTATGTAVILTALLVAAGAAVGVATDVNVREEAGQQAERLGLAGAITLLVVLLIAYYCGGYVAGRMARFNGVKQGVAVWIWTIVIAAAVAIAGAVLGDQYNVLDRVGGFPRLPVGGDATTGGIIAAVIALTAALVGAILGGLAGMRFHRRVDRAGLEPDR